MHSDNQLFLKQLDEAINSEIEDTENLKRLLVESKKRIRRFDTILKQSDKELAKQVHQFEHEFELRVSNERVLAQQTKYASMGEMMDAVAHQWKQPLNAISMLTDLLLIEYQNGEVDKKYIKNYKNILWKQINHLLNTLSEFRSFFRTKEKSIFNMHQSIDAVLLLVKDEFLKEMISFEIEGDDTIELYGIENEFKHIILNILNNAKDVFKERDILNRMIKIKTHKEHHKASLSICDNAGGIPLAVINDIFKHNVTTKKSGKGTGIGLYMSMQIVEKMGATLTAKNRGEGACFTLRTPITRKVNPR